MYNIYMDENLHLDRNTEIANALKEFGVEQGATAQSQVPDIVDAMRSQRIEIPKNSDIPKMIAFVMKYSGGLIKNENQAGYLLVILTLIMFGLSLFFFFRGKSIPQQISPAVLKQMQQMSVNTNQ